MSLLLMMGGSDTPNTRSLFANNEAGLAIDVGDRYGASESKRTWRRNLLTNSERFTAWTNAGANVTANNETAPDGTLTASTINRPGGSGYAITNTVTLLPSTVYTLRINVKAGTQSTAAFGVFNGSLGGFTTGTATVVSGPGSISGTSLIQISGLTSSWTQITLTFTSYSSGANDVYFYPVTSSSLSPTSGTNIIWGFQLEQSSTPTEYQRITDFSTEFKSAYPTHSLYQDSNGVTPAVSPGDPVGLILDTARGGLDQLGSELVTNGGFDSDTSWNKGTGWAISGGKATFTGGTASYLDQLPGALTAGRFYRFAITVDSITSGNTIQIYLGASPTISTISAAGTYVYYAICQSPASSLGVAIRATSTNPAHTAVIDNISIREIPGNHAYQTTSGSRPLLARTPDGGRRNLLTYSEQFDNAAWTKVNIGITANGDTAPDGTATADKFTETAITNQFFVNGANAGSTSGAGESRTISCYVKAAERSWVRLQIGGTAYPSSNVWFNVGTGAVGTQTGGTGTIQSVGNGWYRCSVTATSSGAGTVLPYVFLSSADNTFSYTGVLGNGAWVWGAQLETGSSATAYQKVGLTSDVTEAGKRDCWGLLFDSSDDSLQTASVDFSATDKMTVMAGVRKSSDAAAGMIVELGSSSAAGSFSFLAPNSVSPNGDYYFRSRGTGSSNATSAKSAPTTDVLSGIGDISGDISSLRINSAVAATSTADQGTGNYTNNALYIGSRGGSSLRFNGILYTLIVRGATTPTGTIADFEKNLLARRCGVTF